MFSFQSESKEVDDDDWGDDFTDEAIKQRMDELSDAAKGLAFTDDLEKSAEDRLNMVYETIKVCVSQQLQQWLVIFYLWPSV